MKSVLPLLAVLLIVTAGCGGVRPYRAMARAATSEENVFAQAQDKDLKVQLREALLAPPPPPLALVLSMRKGRVAMPRVLLELDSASLSHQLIPRGVTQASWL